MTTGKHDSGSLALSVKGGGLFSINVLSSKNIRFTGPGAQPGSKPCMISVKLLRLEGSQLSGSQSELKISASVKAPSILTLPPRM